MGFRFKRGKSKGARIERVEQTLRALTKYEAKKEKQYERGMIKAALFLLRKSQQIVPIDTGALKGSGKAYKLPHTHGFNVEVRVTYGMKYAIFVHENMTAKHKKGKQAKFLEGPARELRQDLVQIVIKECRKKR